VDPAYAQAVRAGGRRVWAYTVNEPELARRLAEAGVSGLFTDHPERFLKPVASPPLL
jgi:glycerophosphoryl diester phosphodiesterase